MKKYIVPTICIVFAFLGGLNLYAADQRVVKVGAFNLYPAVFKDTDGAVKGFYVDALTAIEQKENIRFEYIYGSWSEGLERIKTGEVDMLTSVAFTPERAGYLDYVKTPLLTVWGELYVPLSSDIDGIFEVRGKKIAVMKNDFNARHFIELVKKFDIACEFVEMPGFNDVFAAVATKEVDAGVVNNTFGVAKHAEFGLRSTGVVFNPFDIFFAVAKGKNRDLLVMLDKYLVNWRQEEDSPYKKAREKWLHGTHNIIQVIPNWLMTIVLVISLLALCAIAFVVILRKQVLSKTRSVVEASKRYQIVSERQNAILASVPDIIMEVDANRIYTWTNSAGLEFFGDDVCGKEASYYFAGDQNTYEAVQPLLDKSKDVAYVESLQRRKDGAVRLLAWWCKSLRDEQGNVYGLLSTARDITERKQAEEAKEYLETQLRQTQKMEAIGTLAGGIAHDFNNILTTIEGYASLIAMKLPKDDQSAVDAEHILSAARRAGNLTRELLAFSRKQQVRRVALDLNDMLRGVVGFLARITGEHIAIGLDTSGGTLVVLADRFQLEQVLMNLASNARDAMPEGGALTIRTGRVQFDAEHARRSNGRAGGEYALLSVADTGTGMDETTRQRVFDPFFTTKDVGKGTGLGLSTVFGIIQQHEGLIDLHSSPGAGTRFDIYLPLAAEGTPIETAGGGSAVAQEAGTGTILVVEDEPAVREICRRVLSGAGYSVLAAENGEAGLRVFQEHRTEIDLVLTDVLMPKRSGRQLYQDIRAAGATQPVLFMSGYTGDMDILQDLERDGLTLISKPMDPGTLLQKVRAALDAARG